MPVRLEPFMYAGIAIDNSNAYIYIYDGFFAIDYHTMHIQDSTKEVVEYLKEYIINNKCKIILAGLCMSNPQNDLYRKLWFDLDILPCLVNAEGSSLDERACSAARKATSFLGAGGGVVDSVRISVGFRHEVEVDGNSRLQYCSLADYEPYAEDFAHMINLAKLVNENKLSIGFFNSTPQGGGVALMRHAIIRLLRLLKVDSHWFVMKPNPQVFKMTKHKFHNVLQGIDTSSELYDVEIQNYEQWCKSNFDQYWRNGNSPLLKNLSMIVIDDPQPSALIPHIKSINGGSLVYRSHIEIRSDLCAKKGTPQNKVWSYIMKNIQQVDYFVSHPVPAFVPKDIPQESVRYFPATTDPLDGLNKKLNSLDITFYRNVFNRLSGDQLGRIVDFEKPYIAQIARFDPSKGYPDVIEAFYQLYKVMGVGTPQLVLTGHGSIDDPESGMIYKMLLLLLNTKYKQIKNLVYLVKIGPCDQILNCIVSGAKFTLQLSYREGFEIKVTESLSKGIPVIAYDAGGISLQIKKDVNGFVVPVGDTTTVKDKMYALLTDSDLYARMSKEAQVCNSLSYYTTANAIRWLELLLESKNIAFPQKQKVPPKQCAAIL